MCYICGISFFYSKFICAVHLILISQVMGLPRKRNYSGRWDVLIDMSTKCLNKLLEIAAKKNRNYILDQVLVAELTFCCEWSSCFSYTELLLQLLLEYSRSRMVSLSAGINYYGYDILCVTISNHHGT